MRARLQLLFLGVLLLAGCGHGGGFGKGALRHETDPAWTFVRGVPFMRQNSEQDCGAAALAMALVHGGRPTRVEEISGVAVPEKDKGIRAADLREFARRSGFQAYLIQGTIDHLRSELGLGHPVLVVLVKTKGRKAFSHYEVVVGLRKDGTRIVTLDPAAGPREQPVTSFLKEWSGSSQATLVVWRET